MSFYPKIFVSWSMPDANIARALIKRLMAFGFDIGEYEHNMPPGAPIADTVSETIKEADMTIVLFSDESADRPWITAEMTMARAELDRGMKLVAVDVQPGGSTKRPMFIESKDLLVSPADERSIVRLAEQIADRSGMPTPQIFPAAIFAMTRDQAEELLNRVDLNVEGVTFDAYRSSLCESLGMGTPPALIERLLARYGQRPEDLQPFGAGTTVLDLVNERLRVVNQDRTDKGRKPLFIRWLHDDLRSNDRAVYDEADDAWKKGESLLIIDSLSTWDESVRNAIEQRVTEWGRSAVLWLPPFSQQTGSLEEPLDEALGLVRKVRSQFREADVDPLRVVTHDPISKPSLARWIHRVLYSITDEPSPSDKARAQMNENVGGTRVRPRSMFGGSRRT